MPKSRNGSSLANRSNTGSFEELDMHDRLAARLSDSGTQENEEIVERSENQITTGAGGRINSSSGFGVFDFSSGAPEGTITTNLLQERIQNEIEGEQETLSRPYIDDGFFYTDNPEVYREDVERLQNAAIPYHYENVLNGSNVTFGVELEFVDGDSNAIAEELYHLGLCEFSSMQRYHSRSTPGMWKVERDGSVTDGNRGGEIVSPILRDTPETWRQIETVCEVARRHGARVNFETGAHVHIGVEDALDGKRQRWRRFFKTAASFENTYLRLAGGEQGCFRDNGYAYNSRNLMVEGATMVLPSVEDTVAYQSVIARLGRSRYQTINLRAFSEKKTVEMRAFNGTLTPGIIQANIKYSAGIVNSAVHSRTGETSGATYFDRKRGELINQYTSNSTKDNLEIMKSLDVIFTRKQDKEHILSVLLKNEWSR